MHEGHGGGGREQSLAGFREGVVDNEQGGAAVFQDVPVFGNAPADIERHDHGRRPADRKIELQIAAAVQHQHGNPIALLDTELVKRARELRYPCADLIPCQTSVALEDGDPIAFDLKRASQSLRDVYVCLPASGDALSALEPPPARDIRRRLSPGKGNMPDA